MGYQWIRLIMRQNVFNYYFGKDKEKVKFRSSPFPVDSKFEYKLHDALPLDDKGKEETEKLYSKYNK